MPGENEPQKIPIARKNLSSSIAYKSGSSIDGFITFDVGENYKVLEAIGTGAYGVVCSAIDKKSSRHVAIKKIVNPFDVVTTAKRSLRELKLLLHFKHDNIVGIKDIIQATEKAPLKDVYLVMDLMESDLHHIIRSDQQFTVEHIKYFLYQLLRGIKYIHSANVIHRDLKPSNLLVNENCELKIGDFGMARGAASSPGDHQLFMTEYVATRWYRAPELMLSVGDYCQSIDMWSIGCILAEMIGRKQIFPGKHYVHQLQLVISVLGSPEKSMVSSIRSDRVKNYIKSLPNKKPVPLKSLYPKATEEMLDILGSFLRFNPSDRPSAAKCLSHPFLSGYHDNDDEPLCHTPFDFRFESTVTKEEVKQQVTEVIKEYHEKKTRFTNQLFSVKIVDKGTVSAVSSSTKPSAVQKEKEVFKIPTVPAPTTKSTTTSQNLLFKPETSDVNMKSASSVCSMELGDELLGNEVHKNLSPDRKKVESRPIKVVENVNTSPMITVQVVQSDEDTSDPDGKVSKKGPEKKMAESKKSNSTKKVTISENTKMKIRDTIFASMFAKQKGLGKPLDKVRKSVTAVERQREREEKRKKRIERAALKERKKNAEKGGKEELSDADRSMLDRWTKMQGSQNEAKPTNEPAEGTASAQKISLNRLNRHKSLPSNTANPYKPVQIQLAEKNRPRSYTQDPPPQTKQSVSTSSNDRLITVVMPTKHFTLHKRVLSEGTNPAVSLMEKQNSQGFIPEPSFPSNRPNKRSSFNSDDGQFVATGGGMFIPETQTPVQSNFAAKTTPPQNLTQRPKSIFSGSETSRKFTVFMPGQDPMTPGQAIQQSNVLSTPMGNNLATLSPDTIDFVLNDEFHLRNDAIGGENNTNPNTLSQSFPKTIPHQYNIATPIRPSHFPSTTQSHSDSKFSEKYSTSVLSKYTNPVSSKNEGGMFVPVADDSVNLNNHHYRSVGMLETPSAGANGGGYGLGLDLSDIFPQSAGLSMDVTGDCSPSLLADWLDIRCLEPDDMESLQRELELGSPMCVDNDKIVE